MVAVGGVRLPLLLIGRLQLELPQLTAQHALPHRTDGGQQLELPQLTTQADASAVPRVPPPTRARASRSQLGALLRILRSV